MKEFEGKTIAVIGVGNIGRILLKRLFDAGIIESQVIICESDPARAQKAADEFHVEIATLGAEICAADILLLAVPPKAELEVLRTIGNSLKTGQTVVSFAAAVPLNEMVLLVPKGVALVRVMPNASSLVGEGMNPVAYMPSTSAEAKNTVEAILACLGQSIEVRDDQMSACVGLTGAAMRTLLPSLEGMIDAGMEAGFSDREARTMAAQVARGTAALLLETELTIDELKALTPMQTVDEELCREITRKAAMKARANAEALERKLHTAWPLPSRDS